MDGFRQARRVQRWAKRDCGPAFAVCPAEVSDDGWNATNRACTRPPPPCRWRRRERSLGDGACIASAQQAELRRVVPEGDALPAGCQPDEWTILLPEAGTVGGADEAGTVGGADEDLGCADEDYVHIRQEEVLADSSEEAEYGELEVLQSSSSSIATVLVSSLDLQQALKEGLLDAGFYFAGDDVLVHGVSGVTVEFAAGQAIIDLGGRAVGDLAGFAAEVLPRAEDGELMEAARRFAQRLLDRAHCGGGAAPATPSADSDHKHDDSDHKHDGAPVNTSLTLDTSVLPCPKRLGADRERPLRIVTYGRTDPRPPPTVDRHYTIDHRGIRYRLSGREAAKCSGLDELIQARVCRCLLFHDWVSMVVHEIEASGLKSVGIFCWKGRHRSVAAGELLRRCYYPQAEVQHLSL